MTPPKFCIFCGGPPDEKTREHVLPRWLIALTGPPKRVVYFGVNYRTFKRPRFDWANFVFPACAACNQRYSDLEGSAKEIVERLLQGTPVTGRHYVILLDWLDKIRIGLWLGYFYLHGNPMGISQHYHIQARIGQKDRMVAIYTIDTDRKGLNAVGAETPNFQLFHSCFSLNVNCIHILNMSWDYMCSARCGFPFPRKIVMDLDGEQMLECFDFIATHKIKHPILRRRIIKPAMHIYQPVLQLSLTNQDIWLQSMLKDGWLRSMLIPGSEPKGMLIRQYDSHTEVIKCLDSPLEYNEVTGHDCKPLKEIMAQTYELQISARADIQYKSADPTRISSLSKIVRAVDVVNKKCAHAFKSLQQSDIPKWLGQINE